MDDIYKIIYNDSSINDTEYVTIIMDSVNELYHIISLTYHREFVGVKGNWCETFATWRDASNYLYSLKYSESVSDVRRIVIKLK